MAIHIKHTYYQLCPSCQRRLWQLPRPTTIATPILKCSYCGLQFTEPYASEWDCHSSRRRFDVMLQAYGPALLCGVGACAAVGIAYYILAHSNDPDSALQLAPLLGAPIWVPAAAVMAFLLVRRSRALDKQIRESRTRLADADYREQLERFGIKLPPRLKPPRPTD